MEVYKFGGASVSSAKSIQNMAAIVKSAAKDHLLIVISAMGKMTNKLEELSNSYISNDSPAAHQHLDEVKAYHFGILHELFSDPHHPVFNEVSNAFVEIEWLLEEQASDAPDYIYDQIVSIGEIVSTKIVSAYLKEVECEVTWADARNYIQTDNSYREALVDWDRTSAEIQQHLLPLLKKSIVVTQGFIGGTSENFTTTLGREGSDYSAAIFAACLDAKSLTIWKDVPGVLNADPKWFNETERIPQLSYHDAIELTYYGATVIHPKTIKPLQNRNIPLYVRSFLDALSPGTEITALNSPLPVPSFIFKVNQVLISIFPKDFSFIIEENLSGIFSLFHKHKVKVNTMLNSAISFSVSVDHDEKKIQDLIAELSVHYKVKYNTGLELVTIRYYNQDTIDRVTVDKQILLEAVLNKEVQDYINCHLQADVHQLAMAKSPFAEVSSRELATQISAKRKSEKKLPTWYATPFIYYPEPLYIEQSSSEKTAAYKASLLAKGSVLDLTGGFGVDSYYFSKRAERVVHCEINTRLSEIVFNNLKALKIPNIECVAGDGLAYLKSIPDHFGSIYIDPARRSHSGKVFMLQDCTPNVIEHLDLLLNRATRVILKAAPLLDISAALKELSHVAQIHIVSTRNECKELLFILEKDAKGPVKITSTALNDRIKQFSFSKEDPIEIHFPSAVATYLYEPDVALLKSGGFYQIAVQYDLLKLEEQTQLYTSEEY
eukprot:gene17154-20566_t